MQAKIKRDILESIAIKEALLATQLENIAQIAKVFINALKAGKKIIFFGNGGSAADSQHLAAELVGRFQKERKAFAAISLTTNTSSITAIANDYDQRFIFSRQLEALGKRGDVAVGISTSGSSQNVREAIKRAKRIGMRTVAFTGEKGSSFTRQCDFRLVVPSPITCRIQEAHIHVGHIICALVEAALG
jgi:D-sedoheptulose 7-phosphate isomerase